MLTGIKRITIAGMITGIVSVLMIANVHAQKPDPAILSVLKGNPKLQNAKEVLSDFYAGAAETGVIVYLKPSAAANALSAQSRLSARAPAAFDKPGAPPFYNLRDESVKKELAATVRETVERVIGELKPVGMTVKQKFTYQFGFSAQVTPAALVAIVNNPNVVGVEKVRILQANLAQGIPLMNATTPRSTYSGSGVSIAICDTGIDTSHPRLGNGGSPIFNSKVIGGYDTGDNDADPRPDPVNGEAHGTACAGIAAGDTGTVGDYIGGVAYGAKLYAIKISTGTTGSATSPAMIAGWEWAVTHQNDDPNNPIMIISTSFGGGQYNANCDSASSGMTTAAANAVAAGITVFASSGNDGYCDSMGWPACISYVNSVGAVYDANFGNYYPCVQPTSCATTFYQAGACSSTGGYYAIDSTNPDMVTSYSNSASFLTMFAPSNSAYTLDILGAGGYSTGDYDTSFGGTSAACPYAAGAAAILQSAAKETKGSFLSPAKVQEYLVTYGDSVTDGKVAVTKPRVNLGNAVDALPCSLEADGTPCNDGNACTTNDTCSSGVCVGGPPPNCNDSNVCTDDSCDPASGCVNINNTAPCDDGNACTTADTCAAGTCVGGPPPNCNDSNVCTDDSCDPASGCLNTCAAIVRNDVCCADQVCSNDPLCSFSWYMFLPAVTGKPGPASN